MEDTTTGRRALGAQLREARAGRTQEEIAALAGVSQAFVSTLENGGKEPTASGLVAVLRALGVPPARWGALLELL